MAVAGCGSALIAGAIFSGQAEYSWWVSGLCGFLIGAWLKRLTDRPKRRYEQH
jgi:hypothetical protein